MVFNPVVGRYHLSCRLKALREIELQNSPIQVSQADVTNEDQQAIDQAVDEVNRSLDLEQESADLSNYQDYTVTVNSSSSSSAIFEPSSSRQKSKSTQEKPSSSRSSIPPLEEIELHPESNSFSSPEKSTVTKRNSKSFRQWTTDESEAENRAREERRRRTLLSRKDRDKRYSPVVDVQESRDNRAKKYKSQQRNETCRDAYRAARKHAKR